MYYYSLCYYYGYKTCNVYAVLWLSVVKKVKQEYTTSSGILEKVTTCFSKTIGICTGPGGKEI